MPNHWVVLSLPVICLPTLRLGHIPLRIATFGSGALSFACGFTNSAPGRKDISRPFTDYTVSFFLPLSRLAFSTCRPPRVLILARKPCTRLRRIFFGLYVSDMITPFEYGEHIISPMRCQIIVESYEVMGNSALNF